MKNKTTVYLLLPIVIVVWGVIIFRVFSFKEANVEVELARKSDTVVIEEEACNVNLELLLNYKDPFFNIINSKKKSNYASGITKDIIRNGKSVKQENKISMPFIKYNGMLINESKNKRVGLFEIQNKDLVLSEGESFNNVVILNIWSDSVLVKYKDIEFFTFKKRKEVS